MSDDMQLEEVQPNSSVEETSKGQENRPDEWQSLDGRSQDRFRKLAAEKKKAQREAERLQTELEAMRRVTTQIPMPSQTRVMNPDEKSAWDTLQTYGMADREYVDRQVKEKVQAIEDRLYFDNLHSKLETSIKSKKGLPAYDRDEVEEYMKEKQIYDPQAAYNSLYHDEIVSYEAKQLSSKTRDIVKTEQTKSRIGASQPWTRESLADRLRQPDGREFFIKNKEKILRMQGKLD